MTAPFDAFVRSLRLQTPLRAAITAAYRRPEPECVPPLLDLATLTPAATARARALARRLVEALRAKVPSGGVEGVIQDYALSSQEGVALMCRSMSRPIRARSCSTRCRSASTPPPPPAMPA